MAVRWIHLKACGSVMLYCVISAPLALSTALRVSSRSVRDAITDPSAAFSANLERAISIAGTRAVYWNGLTR